MNLALVFLVRSTSGQATERYELQSTWKIGLYVGLIGQLCLSCRSNVNS